MGKLSELPFVSISKENLMAASDMLNTQQKGELLEMIIDAVLNDAEPTSSTKCVSGVFNQFMAVIERKSKSYFGRKKHIDDVNDQKKQEKEQPIQEIEPKHDFDPQFSNPVVIEEKEREYLNSFEKPTPEECVEILQGIKTEKGDYAMTREANMMGNKYGYSVKDLCISARGY